MSGNYAYDIHNRSIKKKYETNLEKSKGTKCNCK